MEAILHSNHFWKIFSVVFLGAVGDSINPCAIVTLLLFLIFLFSLRKQRRFIFLLGVLYILGIYVSYFLIGIGLLKTLHLFGIPHLFAKIMALVALVIGIATLYEFFSKKRLRIFSISPNMRLKLMNWANKSSIGGALGLGILVGVFEFPCTGGIYFAVIALLAAKTMFLDGLFWLLFYNLIFVLPLIIILILTTRPLVADKLLSWEEQKSHNTRLAVGIMMIILAITIWFWTT
ncbi:MAG: hypothetical protein NT135_02860 [Candidatus Berkelbacteria bacterium]|nr:hypothetical protein [Candidatus Berkelbacteria bacterium]